MNTFDQFTTLENNKRAASTWSVFVEEDSILPLDVQKALDKLPGSFDARDWAAAFVKLGAVKPSVAKDEETMVTWFANALMRGYDEKSYKKD